MKNNRVQILDGGKWRTLECRDMAIQSPEDAIAARDYFASVNIENEYRAQSKMPAKFDENSRCIGLAWRTI